MATFRGADAYDFPGVETLPVVLTFPEPFTVQDYIDYRAAAAPAQDDEDGIGNINIMRVYRGAMAVATTTVDEEAETAVVPEDDGETAVLTLDATDPNDPELPLNFARWVADCAEQVIGPQINVEALPQIRARRAASQHVLPVFSTTDNDLPALLPALREYDGRVLFHEPLTASLYRAWTKAQRTIPKYSDGDFRNSLFMRQLRGAVPLVKVWDVDDVAWQDISRHNWHKVPLVVASFLIEAADVYLSKRMSLKKSQGKLAQLR